MRERQERPASRAPPYSRMVKAGVISADLLVIVLAALVSLQTLEGHRAAARTNADNLARFLGAGLDAALDKVDLTLRSVADEQARLAAAGPIDGPALEAFLARHQLRTPDVASLRVIGVDGVARYNAPAVRDPVSLADREYFTALRARAEDALFVSRPFQGRILLVPLVVAARRLTSPAGDFAGVVSASIPLSRLAGLFSGIEVGARGVVELRWQDASLLVGTGPGVPLAFSDARFPAELREAALARPAGVVHDARSPADGLQRTYAVRRLNGYPLLVIVGLAPDDYLAGWRRAQLVVWLLVAAFLVLTVGVTWYGTPAWQRAQVRKLLMERTEHLRESEERFRIAFQTSPDAIALTRVSDGAYVAVNEGFLALTGYTEAELLGHSSLELGVWTDPADRARLVEAVRRDGFLVNLEARFRGKGRTIDGLMSARRIVLRGEPLLLTITRDVTAWKAAETERDRLRTQVLQAQRLEGIGRLAGGIAHDFNNLLTVILGCIESLRDRVGDAPEPREDLEQIAAAAGRARDLTGQLLAFARKQVIAPVALDLGDVVRDGEKLLRRLIGEDVALSVDIEPLLWPVLCDPAQVEQVLLNLAVNARDAMPAGGTLSIRVGNVEASLPIEAQGGAREAGQWVRLSVRDSGTGMTPEVEAHLFEPFFTTKTGAKGTGLGLATVHGIVAQNGGHIEVETALGHGSTFHVFLPRAAAQAVPAARATPAPRAVVSGGAAILVVEDDPLVRNVTVRALRSAGHEVLVAGNGDEAIALASQRAGPIDLVVTDVVMPGLSGPQVVAALQAVRPGLRALFVSGYPADALAQRRVLDGVALLAKPFTAASLLERVRTLLEAGPRAKPPGDPPADSPA